MFTLKKLILLACVRYIVWQHFAEGYACLFDIALHFTPIFYLLILY